MRNFYNVHGYDGQGDIAVKGEGINENAQENIFQSEENRALVTELPFHSEASRETFMWGVLLCTLFPRS